MSQTSPNPWNESPLSPGSIALVCYHPGFSEAASPWLAAVHGGDLRPHFIRPDRVVHFLNVHGRGDHDWVCDDVGQLSARMVDGLGGEHDHAFVEQFWQLLRRNRVHDLSLMADIVKHSDSDLENRIDKILDDYQGECVPRNDRSAGIAQFPHADAGKWATALMRAAESIRLHLGEVAGQTSVAPAAVAQFGPLTAGVQVRSAAAVATAGGRALRIDPEQKDRLINCCERIRDKHLERLRATPGVAAFLKAGHAPKLTRNGFPTIAKEAFRKWVNASSRDARDLHGLPLPVPVEGSADDARTDIELDRWEWWQASRPDLYRWRSMWTVCRLRRALETANQEIVPEYTVFPYLRSRGLDLALIRSLGVPVFRPSDGCKFLNIRLDGLRVRSLVAQLARTHADSALVGAVREGADPVAWVAARLSRVDAREFANLPDADRRGREAFAAALLDLVPTGIATPGIHDLLDARFGISRSARDVEDAVRQLLSDACPELGEFLRDDRVDRFAGRIGVDAEGFRDAVAGLVSGKGRVDARSLADALRGYDNHNRMHLREFAKLPGIAQDSWVSAHLRLEDRRVRQEYYRLLEDRSAVTLTGRVYDNVCWAWERNILVSHLADDALKEALFALVAAGYRLAAIAGDEILVEFDAQADPLADEDAKSVAAGAAEAVLGGIAVPVSVGRYELW
jgi:hypothetical protein